MVPLLRSPSDNGHATLVTMLERAVRDNITNENRLATEGPYGAAAQIIRQYLDLPVSTVWTTPWRSRSCTIWTASSTMIRLSREIFEEGWNLPEGS
ncbi:hypothetical protein CGLO_11674 [Colletotrichum gloeosporioides Cg-14]|uniref:Uncharacterized protein n=1 Tax=Colletotrichum gloeosporioides (strain Cg-14) TaxID=1237896 RepID=T0LL78_COLGC|nr:hypothetical protein CGLO_11674 [Colletotrichum gloeosporioides Cg-14]